MKSRLYLLSPNGNDFLEQQIAAIKECYNEFIYIDKVIPFDELPNISDDYEKVFAIDPDFCDWNIPNTALDIRGLVAVCLNTTSYSWINLEYAKNKNIAVTNVRHWSTESVSEQGILMMLNIARKLPMLAHNKMEINFETMRGMELCGKTAGIIGLGNIGACLAELCDALEMKVCYWSRQSEDERFNKVELRDIFKNADVIFPALPKNNETEKLITDSLLESMKSRAIFIDVAGNLIYNQRLLLDMVKDCRIYGYGFEELYPKKYEGNVLAIPPVAYYTKEAMDRNTAQWLDCIISVKSDRIKNGLN